MKKPKSYEAEYIYYKEGEDNILLFPSGDLNKNLLEKILSKAKERNLNNNDKIEICGERRVKNFNPDNPNYESFSKYWTLSKLKKNYEEVFGHPFKLKK